MEDRQRAAHSRIPLLSKVDLRIGMLDFPKKRKPWVKIYLVAILFQDAQPESSFPLSRGKWSWGCGVGP